jgi:potassium/hydrogen antiporter
VTQDALLILITGALLIAGVLVSLAATRLRLPALVLFLGFGMAIGTDGLGWIDFENYELTRLIGSISLSLILFEGGLSTGYRALGSVLRAAVSLAIFATLGTAVIVGIAAMFLFSLPFLEAFLLGAILSGTDGAAVFALLRGTRLRRDLALTLEGEAGFNDPIAVLLVLACIELISVPHVRSRRRSPVLSPGTRYRSLGRFLNRSG